MKLKIPLPPQFDTGPFIGQVLFLYSSGLALLGILTNLMGLSAYYVILTDKWPVLGIVPIWGLYIGIFVLFTLLMIFAYSIITPSKIAFSNLQACKHDNPVIKNQEEILKRIDRLEQIIKSIKTD